MRATDAGGNVDSTPARREWTIAQPPGPNLIVNWSFEGSLDGWRGHNATLSLVDGTVGAQAARVTGSTLSFSMYPSPRHVASTEARPYTASAWMRTATAGRNLCVRIREWNAGVSVGGAQACVIATGAWQKTPTATYTPAAGNSLEVYAFMTGIAAAGESFDVDGIELR